MAQTTTNYGLYKPEATDTYNHLVYDNPNMDTIDAAMKANSDHAVDNASCIKSGTVHSVTRSNTSCPVFKFTATGDWNTGDTMNVDGTPVSVFLPNGTAPLTGCFVINTEVLAIISGSRVTLMCPVIPDAADVPFNATGTTLISTNVEGALQELNEATNIQYDSTYSVKQKIDRIKPDYDNTENIPVVNNTTYTYTALNNGFIIARVQNGPAYVLDRGSGIAQNVTGVGSGNWASICMPVGKSKSYDCFARGDSFDFHFVPVG